MTSARRRGKLTETLAALAGLAAVLVTSVGCKKPDQGLAARGRRVYMTTCTSCHNPDPHRDGNVGPAVAASALALVRARVVKAEYPRGYYPKRSTKLMIALPHLEPDIEALYEFLNQ
jgi:mono/diheme cytochrome c family protein